MKKYLVLREHTGDKFYKTGDTRLVSDVDAIALKKLGLIREIEENSLDEPRNKMKKDAKDK